MGSRLLGCLGGTYNFVPRTLFSCKTEPFFGEGIVVHNTFLDNQAVASPLEDAAIPQCFVEEALKQVYVLLDERDGCIFTCHYSFGMNSQEIASVLPNEWQLSAVGVRSRLSRIIQPAIKQVFQHFKDAGTVPATDDVANPVHNKIVSRGKRKRDGGFE